MQAYDIPELEVHLKLARLNLPPHTIMRGPGFLQAVMVIEQVAPHLYLCQLLLLFCLQYPKFTWGRKGNSPF